MRVNLGASGFNPQKTMQLNIPEFLKSEESKHIMIAAVAGVSLLLVTALLIRKGRKK